MEMERIMFAQYESINEVDTQGTNQAYVCRVARINLAFECLDIAAPSTLRTSSGESTFSENYTSITGALNGNLFMHDNLLVDIAKADTLVNVTSPLFGMLAPCGDKIMGDGVINGFDAYVIASAQFGSGVYGTLSRAFDEVATVNGRNDTKDRCNNDPYTRLEWQLAVARDPCFAHGDSLAPFTPPPSAPPPNIQEGRRLQLGPPSQNSNSLYESPLYAPMRNVASRTQWLEMSTAAKNLEVGIPNSKHTWSSFGIKGVSNVGLGTFVPEIKNLAPPKQSLALYGTSVAQASSELGARVFEYMDLPQGKWYWINVPGVHASLDLTIFGGRNRDPIRLTNLKAPRQGSTETPVNPSEYELRFIRHREFYNLPVGDCVAITSSRSPEIAMQKGVVSLAQPIREGYQMCGYDLMLWKPDNTPIYTPECPVAVAAGSVTMNGLYGSVQLFDSCATITSQPMPPPVPDTPPVPAPAPPKPSPALPLVVLAPPAAPPRAPCPSPGTQMVLHMEQKLAASTMHGCHVADVEAAMHRLLYQNDLQTLNQTTTVELVEELILDPTDNVYGNAQCNVLSVVKVTTVGDVHSINELQGLLSTSNIMENVIPLQNAPPTPCGNITVTVLPYSGSESSVDAYFIFTIVASSLVALLAVAVCVAALCCGTTFVAADKKKDKVKAKGVCDEKASLLRLHVVNINEKPTTARNVRENRASEIRFNFSHKQLNGFA